MFIIVSVSLYVIHKKKNEHESDFRTWQPYELPAAGSTPGKVPLADNQFLVLRDLCHR